MLQRLAGRIVRAEVDRGHLVLRRHWGGSEVSPSDHTALLVLAGQPVIVRSSAHGEDSATASNAGRYESIVLHGKPAVADIARGIQSVFDSYGRTHPDDAVLVQRYLTDVRATAVVTTRTPGTGAPYIMVVVDDEPNGTDGVTSGTARTTTWHVLRCDAGASHRTAHGNRLVRRLIAVSVEATTLVEHSDLDLELGLPPV